MNFRKMLFIQALMLCFVCAFSKEQKRLELPSDFKEIAKKYEVSEITMHEDRAVYYDEKYVQFVRELGAKNFEPRAEIKQKGKNYTIEFFDLGYNSFHVVKGKFKVVDEDNQVIQIIEFDDIDDPYYGFFDADMDGCMDLMIMDHEYKGENSYHIYYWSNFYKKFKEDDHEMRNPAWDLQRNYIYEKFYNKDGDLIYIYYEFRFGIKRFVGQVTFKFENKKEGYRLKIIYTDIENASEGEKGVFTFTLPRYDDFKDMSEDKKANVRKQYEKMVKMLNDI